MRSLLKINYDANFSEGEFRGMGKYINAFIRVLENDHKIISNGLLKGKSILPNPTFISFGYKNYVLWEQFSLLKYVNNTNEIMIFPYNTAPLFLKKSSLNVLILHDLIFLNKSNTKSIKQKIGKLYRSFIVPRIVNKFDYVITVSNYSKLEIVNKLGVDAHKISVIPNCVDLPNNYEISNPAYETRSNTIFHIGGEPEYKNSKALIYAFSLLPNEIKLNFKLKVIGIRNPKTLIEYKKLTIDLNISESIEFLSYQTDDEIVQLYKTSKLFVFPSKLEGFGIPLIEAMRYGCPLACSKSSCLPEIAGNAAEYFDPESIASISETISKMLKEKKMSDIHEQVNLGYDQVSKYSFKIFKNKVNEWFKSTDIGIRYINQKQT